MTTLAGRIADSEAAQSRADQCLLRWFRREVNRDLRRWRAASREPGPGQADAAERVADCKAKLELIHWAGSWQRVRDADHAYEGRPDVQAKLLSDLELIMHGVRALAAAYRDRAGWRDEFERMP